MAKNEKVQKTVHVCGEFNGVMGKGAFSKDRSGYRCVECGKLHEELPKGYLEAVKKMDPKRAALLVKGSHQKTTGQRHLKWSQAGHLAWKTRLANQAAKAQKQRVGIPIP